MLVNREEASAYAQILFLVGADQLTQANTWCPYIHYELPILEHHRTETPQAVCIQELQKRKTRIGLYDTVIDGQGWGYTTYPYTLLAYTASTTLYFLPYWVFLVIHALPVMNFMHQRKKHRYLMTAHNSVTCSLQRTNSFP